MSSAKEETAELIQNLPDDASYDDILREIRFARMVARGLEDVRQGRVISTEEVRRRVQSWGK